MFGSITNWINTNLPQVQQQVQQQIQQVQEAMPPVSIPDFFNMNKTSATSDAEKPAEQQPQQQQPDEANNNSNNDNPSLDAKQPSDEATTTKEATNKTDENSDAAATGAEQKSGADAESTFANTIEIDTQKAIDTAKELGSKYIHIPNEQITSQ